MNTRLSEITETALALPVDERAILADRLFESLDNVPDDAIQDAWLREAVRRAEEVRSGAVQPIDGDLVFAEARERLRK